MWQRWLAVSNTICLLATTPVTDLTDVRFKLQIFHSKGEHSIPLDQLAAKLYWDLILLKTDAVAVNGMAGFADLQTLSRSQSDIIKEIVCC